MKPRTTQQGSPFSHRSTTSGHGRFGLPVVFATVLLVSYVMLAAVMGWQPFPPVEAIACPSSATAYQVFEDGTGSSNTQNRSNWAQQAKQFVNALGPCDRVSFYSITAATPGSGPVHEPVWIAPPVNPHASSFDQKAQRDAIARAKAAVAVQLDEMIERPSDAPASDILGVFQAVDPLEVVPARSVFDVTRRQDVDTKAIRMRNALVIFSDGFESAHGIDLENGRSCVTSANLPTLLVRALTDFAPAKGLALYEHVVWVFPTSAGVSKCNSILEMHQFWNAAVRSLQPTARLTFAVNPFDVNPF